MMMNLRELSTDADHQHDEPCTTDVELQPISFRNPSPVASVNEATTNTVAEAGPSRSLAVVEESTEIV